MKLDFKYLFIILFFVMLFPSMRLPVFGTSFMVFFVVLLPIIALFACLYPNILATKFKLLYKFTPAKYFIYFLLWLVLDGLLLVVRGYYNPLYYISKMFLTCFCLFLLPYILPSIVFPKNFSLRQIIRGFFVVLFIFMSLGILFYVGYKFNVNLIKNIHTFLCNEVILNQKLLFVNNKTVRATSVFLEPGWYAEFLFLSLPFVYGFTFSKYKVFENFYVNKFFKYTMLPLVCVSLVLTKSPIWLVFAIIFTFLYCFWKSICEFCHYPIKLFVTVVIIVLICILIFLNQNELYDLIYENEFLKDILGRIIRFFETSKDFNKFVIFENSLASRVISYIAEFKLFLAHPVCGVGWVNSQNHIYEYLISLKIPFSEEIILNIHKYTTTGKMSLNGSILFLSLCEAGMVGTILFYLFLSKTIEYSIKTCKYYSGAEHLFIKSFAISCISLMCVSFYTGVLFTNYLEWFMLGVINPFIINVIDITLKYQRTD